MGEHFIDMMAEVQPDFGTSKREVIRAAVEGTLRDVFHEGYEAAKEDV